MGFQSLIIRPAISLGGCGILGGVPMIQDGQCVFFSPKTTHTPVEIKRIDIQNSLKWRHFWSKGDAFSSRPIILPSCSFFFIQPGRRSKMAEYFLPPKYEHEHPTSPYSKGQSVSKPSFVGGPASRTFLELGSSGSIQWEWIWNIWACYNIQNGLLPLMNYGVMGPL